MDVMATHLVSFATLEFFQSQARLAASAKNWGFDLVSMKTPDDLMNSTFYKQNMNVFRYRRGFGYWLWKPYYIYQTLMQASENDVVIYSDSGVEIAGSLEPLFELARNKTPIVAFGVHRHLNRMWTKRDCFVGLDCDSERFWNAEQWNGFFQVYRRCDSVMKFVAEWLDRCCDPRLITDLPNQLGQSNFPEFRDHRHDQSIFSILCEREKFEKFRDPGQFGNFLKLPEFRVEGEFTEYPYDAQPYQNSRYGTLLNHHRERLVASRQM